MYIIPISTRSADSFYNFVLSSLSQRNYFSDAKGENFDSSPPKMKDLVIL